MRIFNGTWMKAQFQFEPRDLWIGLFWRSTELCWHFYLCIVPLLPLHVTVLKSGFRKFNLVNWDRRIQ
jgi:hypothetical protein